MSRKLLINNRLFLPRFAAFGSPPFADGGDIEFITLAATAHIFDFVLDSRGNFEII